MNREILFRGKRTEDEPWVYGWYCKYAFGGWPLKDCIIPLEQAEDGYLEHVKIDPVTIGQYTGLTDKNDVKIFEGDIVLISMPIPWAKPIVHLSDVYFESGCFSVNWGGNYRPHHRTRIDAFAPGVEFEVIGNIHDNPEILGGNDGTTDRTPCE